MERQNREQNIQRNRLQRECEQDTQCDQLQQEQDLNPEKCRDMEQKYRNMKQNQTQNRQEKQEQWNENVSPFFSVIVVCYNAGAKLKDTVENILSQTCRDYEVIVKDAGSEDGSLQSLPGDERIRIFTEKDKGIYDAMNQATAKARGRFVVFMNCGDYFHGRETLEEVKSCILQQEHAKRQSAGQSKPQSDGQDAQGSNRQCEQRNAVIYYGNILEKTSGQIVSSNPKMDDFACFRNVPNHQACYYSRALFDKRGFDLSLRVRADYEHFLWCRYRGGAQLISMPLTVADYEGGGFSETAENRRISAKEHRQVTEEYLPKWKCMLFRGYLILSLQPLREKIAQNPKTAAAYDALKNGIYRLMGRK